MENFWIEMKNSILMNTSGHNLNYIQQNFHNEPIYALVNREMIDYRILRYFSFILLLARLAIRRKFFLL